MSDGVQQREYTAGQTGERREPLGEGRCLRRASRADA
jgi:hypothetical protein